MKKLLSISVLLGSLLLLSACGNSQEEPKTEENKAIENMEQKTDTNKLDEDKMTANEYQFNLVISAETDKGEESIDMDIYKKGDKALYVVNKFAGLDQTPISPKKTLLVGDTVYTNMEVNGQDVWLKSEAMGMDMSQIFDLEEIKKELAQANEQKTETIEGKKMECFYKNDGKICTYKGIVTYGEGTDPDGTVSKIHINDYKTSVDDDLFEIPTNITDMEEFAKMMQASMGQQN